MRHIRYLIVAWVALALSSCAVPGGIYRDYEGPERELNEIAVLDWSACDACTVTQVDGNSVRGPGTSWRVSIDHAHLSPGQHTITVRTYYEDLGRRSIDLQAAFQPARVYLVKLAACFDCDPFEAEVSIEDMKIGVNIAQSTATGIGAYREIARKREECEDECKDSEKGCRKWDSEEDCATRRSSCETLCRFSDAMRQAASRREDHPLRPGQRSTALDISVNIPLQEQRLARPLVLVKTHDERIPGRPAGTRTAAFGLPLGHISFDPPEIEIVKQFLEVELTRILHEKGVHSPQEFDCDIEEFNVYTNATLFYWDVIAQIRLLLKQDGKEFELSGRSKERTFIWPGETIIASVVDGALSELAASLTTVQLRR